MRRIQRASDKESLVQTLTTGENPPFKEIWRLLVFAAAVGKSRGRREPLKAVDSGKAIPAAIFSNSPAWPGFHYLLALVEKDDSAVLGGGDDFENERLVIFEEYANAGLSIIQEELEKGSYLLDAFLQFMPLNQSQSKGDELSKVVI
ncbi:MAG: DNA phosphorothioation-associated protein 4 [Opitutaceae bacterium]